MLTAREALKMSRESIHDVMADIHKEISSAAKSGSVHILYDRHISTLIIDRVKYTLKELGYTCGQTINAHHRSSLSIDWGNSNEA